MQSQHTPLMQTGARPPASRMRCNQPMPGVGVSGRPLLHATLHATLHAMLHTTLHATWLRLSHVVAAQRLPWWTCLAETSSSVIARISSTYLRARVQARAHARVCVRLRARVFARARVNRTHARACACSCARVCAVAGARVSVSYQPMNASLLITIVWSQHAHALARTLRRNRHQNTLRPHRAARIERACLNACMHAHAHATVCAGRAAAADNGRVAHTHTAAIH
jgi:hypothetical protein